MSTPLFNIGPFEITAWNIIFIAVTLLVSTILRRIIHRNLKKYLVSNNISVEGKRVTWLKLFSQLIYVIAFYVIFLTLQLQNPEVSLVDFVEHKIIHTSLFSLSISHIILVFLVSIIAKLAIRIIEVAIAQRLRRQRDYDPGVEYIYVQISKYIIYTIAVLISFKIFFSDISAILTGSLGILVGVGLGLQDVFRDFIAGIVLLVERNLMVGDIIEFPSQDGKEMMVAKVVKVSVRTSQIETRDGNILIIPNTMLTQNAVENWSHGNTLSRFFIDIPVAYGAETEKVTRLLKQAALAHPKVNKKEGVTVRLTEFTENHMLFQLIFWADQSWYINNTRSEIRLEIDRLFREYKVNIPYPQLDIHIASDKRGTNRNTGHYDE